MRLPIFNSLACGSLILTCAMSNAGEVVAIPIASVKALEYHNTSNWFWGLNQGLGLALPLLLLFTGWGASLYGFVAQALGNRRIASVASFAVLYFLLDRSLRLPIAYLWQRARDEAFSTPSQAFIPWIGNQMSGGLLLIGGLTLVAIIAYWLIGKSHQRWWLWAAAAVSIVVLAFLLAEPFTQTYKPLGSSPLEQRIAELAARAGVPRSAIVVERCVPASSCPPGRVIGMGPTRLILLNDALLAQNPESWTLQMVAHEAKHFAKDDNIKAFFLLSGLALAALAFVHLVGHSVLTHWSRRLGFAEFANPASLPLAVLLFNVFYVIALPPVNAFRQHVELEADRYALELNRENTAQGQTFASWASEKGSVPESSKFFLLFRASHPSNATRIRLSNTYHPWLDGKPLKYADDFLPPIQGK